MSNLSKWHLDTEVEISERKFVTDQETKELLEKLLSEAKVHGHYSAAMAVIGFGLMAGRIVEKDPGLK